MTEAKCAIVIYVIYGVWALISLGSIFAILVLLYHDFVSYSVSIGDTFGVFAFIILLNDVLSPLFYVLPIGFETYIVYRIAIKH